MNYIEAYCSKHGISREKATEIISSDLAKVITDYIENSTNVGIAALITAYDTNVCHTLRGELKTLTAIAHLLTTLKAFGEGKNSEPIQEPTKIIDDKGYEQSKEYIKIK